MMIVNLWEWAMINFKALASLVLRYCIKKRKYYSKIE